ncbi:hypothetical protein HPULCUR_010860 [Helicostylum pulchrum]|uniref:Translation initiation factor eIF2B subunit delta n=1 Tax=Helicostylum pulchrum TaxID=562976 RepID=A0ABP9YEG9_9FUNG
MDSNKSTPILHNTSSPSIGQPMSSSYGDQWLGTEDTHIRRRSSLNDTPRLNNKRTATTKSERRATQERQRAEKARIDSLRRVQQQMNSSDTTTTTTTKKKDALKVSRKSILNHLPVSKKPNTDLHKHLHPSVLTLSLLFWDYKIVGSNARCVAVLETLRKVIEDHRPPASATFTRDIQKHLEPHIDFLLNIRYFSLSVREMIRYVKKAMSDLVAVHPPLSDGEAKKLLTNSISQFITARITVADQLIVQYGLSKIEDEGDVILTFAKSSVVESLLLKAKQIGKDFSVVIIDSRPLLEGKNLLKRLTQAGITCQYTLISSIYIALKDVTKVILGSHCILNNGSSYSRIGSAIVAMAATDNMIPVMICAETYKFTNRTQVDSLVMNEKGNPEDLVNQGVLVDWKQISNLNVINLLYDVTPAKYISLVITEVGVIPCTSAPVIWREYK